MAETKEKLEIGDHVEWETSQGKTSGITKKKLTSPTKIKSHKVASEDNPEFLVVTEISKNKAAHKLESLKKTDEKRQPCYQRF